jgi:aldose sugar dehydrogenase
MRLFSLKALFIASSIAAAMLLAMTAHSVGSVVQGPPAGGAAPAAPAEAPPAGQGRGQGQGQGRGRGAVDTLGEGPWDLGTGDNRMHITVVTKGLDHPWGMVFLPDGDMLVTERPGRLRVIRKGVLDPTPIAGLPQIRALSLGGLLDIALHPRFAENRLIYLAYAKPGAEEPARGTTAVVRARWDGGAELTDVKDILVADGYHGGRGAPRGCCGQGPADASHGGRLAFDRAGFLYVTLGDRNYGEKSQDPITGPHFTHR